MNILINGFIAVTFILHNIDYVYGNPRVCYYCDSTEACNDPVNMTKINIEDCLDLPMTNSFLKNLDLSKINSRSTSSKTCITFSGSIGDKLTTHRGCAIAEIEGKGICTYLKNLSEAHNLTNYKCSTCNTNLCNSSTSIFASVAIIMMTIFNGLIF